MTNDPTLVDCPCWEIAPCNDQDRVIEQLQSLCPPDSIFEIEPLHLKDRKALHSDVEHLKLDQGLIRATTGRFSGISFSVRGFSNLVLILAKHFHHNDFLSLVVHNGACGLFNWHDAPGAPIYLAGSFNEDRVSSFASAIGSSYRKLSSWQD